MVSPVILNAMVNRDTPDLFQAWNNGVDRASVLAQRAAAVADAQRVDQARQLSGAALTGNTAALNPLAIASPDAYIKVKAANNADHVANLDAITSALGPADTPEKWDSAVAMLKSQGHTFDPGEDQFANRQAVLNSALSYKEQLDQQNKTRELDISAAKGTGASAPSGYQWSGDGKSLAPIPGGPADKQANPDPLDGLPQVQIDAQGNVDKPSQDAFISALPTSDQTLVKGLINYQLDPTKTISMRAGERERVIALASAADPTFDISQFRARAAMKQSMTSGNFSQALGSSNLVIQHMDQLKKAYEQLGNGDYPAVNYVRNASAQQTGEGAVSGFNTAKKAVAAELAKVFKGVGATDVNSINEWEQNFSINSSPDQMKQSMDTALNLLASRVNTIQGQYTGAMGKPSDLKMLTPKSKQVLQEFGVDFGNTQLGASGGGTDTPAPGAPAKTVIEEKDLPDAMDAAQRAIAGGADRAAVIKTLVDAGVDPTFAGTLK